MGEGGIPDHVGAGQQDLMNLRTMGDSGDLWHPIVVVDRIRGFAEAVKSIRVCRQPSRLIGPSGRGRRWDCW